MFKFLIVILLLLSLVAIATIEAKQSKIELPSIKYCINNNNAIFIIIDEESKLVW